MKLQRAIGLLNMVVRGGSQLGDEGSFFDECVAAVEGARISVYMCICVYVYMCVCVYVYMCICDAGGPRRLRPPSRRMSSNLLTYLLTCLLAY